MARTTLVVAIGRIRVPVWDNTLRALFLFLFPIWFEVQDLGDKRLGGFSLVADSAVVDVHKCDWLAWVLTLFVWLAIYMVNGYGESLAIHFNEFISAR